MKTNQMIRNAETALMMALAAAQESHDWASSSLLVAALKATAKAREQTTESAISSILAFPEEFLATLKDI